VEKLGRRGGTGWAEEKEMGVFQETEGNVSVIQEQKRQRGNGIIHKQAVPRDGFEKFIGVTRTSRITRGVQRGV